MMEKEYYIELGANGEKWDAYGSDLYNGGITALSTAFQAWVTARYGSAATQQVTQNPNSDYTNQLLQLYMMNQQSSSQSSSNDKTLLYVAIGLGAALLLMMMNDSSNKRR